MLPTAATPHSAVLRIAADVRRIDRLNAAALSRIPFRRRFLLVWYCLYITAYCLISLDWRHSRYLQDYSIDGRSSGSSRRRQLIYIFFRYSAAIAPFIAVQACHTQKQKKHNRADAYCVDLCQMFLTPLPDAMCHLVHAEPPQIASRRAVLQGVSWAVLLAGAPVALPNTAHAESQGPSLPSPNVAESINAALQKIVTKAKAPVIVRLVFHDAGTFRAAAQDGGANASIAFELERPENFGLKRGWRLIEQVSARPTSKPCLFDAAAAT